MFASSSGDGRLRPPSTAFDRLHPSSPASSLLTASSPHLHPAPCTLIPPPCTPSPFRSWDTNGDGVISIGEFIEAMRVLGLTAPDTALCRLFGLFDTDGSGAVDFSELDGKLKVKVPKASLLSVSKHQRTLRPGRMAMPEWMEAMRPRAAEEAHASLLPAVEGAAGGGRRRGGGARRGPPPPLAMVRRPPQMPPSATGRDTTTMTGSLMGGGGGGEAGSTVPSLPSLTGGRADRITRERGADLEWWRREVLRAGGRAQRVG